MRIGVDVGGTFTDAVSMASDGRVEHVKVLTRVSRPWLGVIDAMERLGGVRRFSTLIHATTLGTNMLLGQVGLEKPRVVLITSRGFRDVLEIGRQARPEPYNAFFRRPPPLVPRSLRVEIDARVYRDGKVVEPDAEAVKSIALRYCDSRTVFVIHVINCFVDHGALERRIAKLVRSACPEALDVVPSCDVDPAPGEYERGSTAVINAMLRPMFRQYLSSLETALRERGFTGSIYIMQSSGGLAPLSYAREKPAYFIESGPAAGVVAAAALARRRGDELVISFDMGGTTAKASLITRYTPSMTDYFEVGGKYHAGRLVRGSGYPLRVPHIDLVEVSAGGGTIAWVDKGGALRVGPLSAGADPGPACYARGGDKPTITDAHLLLARLPPVIAGGLLELDASLAQRVYEDLARRLDTEPYLVAAEVLRMANVEMARAIRLVSVEKGIDPANAALYAFGGAGPLHAAELAEEVGIARIVVPPYAGVFSALGLLAAGVKLSETLHVHKALEDIDYKALSERIERVSSTLSYNLECNHYTSIRAALRYARQAGVIHVDYTPDPMLLVKRFREKYKSMYGSLPLAPEPPIILDYVIVEAGCLPRLPRLTGYALPTREHHRRVYFLDYGWVDARVYNGVPRRTRGPAVLELPDTTIIVPPGWSAARGDNGEVILERE